LKKIIHDKRNLILSIWLKMCREKKKLKAKTLLARVLLQRNTYTSLGNCLSCSQWTHLISSTISNISIQLLLNDYDRLMGSPSALFVCVSQEISPLVKLFGSEASRSLPVTRLRSSGAICQLPSTSPCEASRELHFHSILMRNSCDFPS